MRAHTPSPKSVPFGATTAARPGFGARRILRMIKLKKQKSRFRCLFVAREICENAALFFATKRRIREDDINAIFLADFSDFNRERVVRADLRRFQPVQQQIHLREQIRQRLWLAAKDAALLQQLSIFNGFALLLQMLKRFDQEIRRCRKLDRESFRQASDR